MTTEVSPMYRREAKDLVNMLFDKNLLNPELKRESIEHLEEFIGFLFQSKCDLAVTASKLIAKFKS